MRSWTTRDTRHHAPKQRRNTKQEVSRQRSNKRSRSPSSSELTFSHRSRFMNVSGGSFDIHAHFPVVNLDVQRISAPPYHSGSLSVNNNSLVELTKVNRLLSNCKRHAPRTTQRHGLKKTSLVTKLLRIRSFMTVLLALIVTLRDSEQSSVRAVPTVHPRSTGRARTTTEAHCAFCTSRWECVMCPVNTRHEKRLRKRKNRNKLSKRLEHKWKLDPKKHTNIAYHLVTCVYCQPHARVWRRRVIRRHELNLLTQRLSAM